MCGEGFQELAATDRFAQIVSAAGPYGYHPRFMVLDSPREADMEIGSQCSATISGHLKK